MTVEAEWDSTITQIKSDFGRLDTLVNNAGMVILKPIEDFTLEDFNRQMLVNMTSVFLGTQRAVALMRDTNTKGSIINMSSVAALGGVYAVSAYAASKAGVLGFTKAIAAETAKQGIRCNTIHPGMIATNMKCSGKRGKRRGIRGHYQRHSHGLHGAAVNGLPMPPCFLPVTSHLM